MKKKKKQPARTVDALTWKSGTTIYGVIGVGMRNPDH